jgi:hypothetical protein
MVVLTNLDHNDAVLLSQIIGQQLDNLSTRKQRVSFRFRGSWTALMSARSKQTARKGATAVRKPGGLGGLKRVMEEVAP